ncbi:hypothetical protein O3P69_009324 [Scylla paramamosain]|uniref:Metalloendopeptidase n=2 Tax=Scylla paramamosain TaxID=85552 RepID=A0AAW0TCG9_SCYPA
MINDVLGPPLHPDEFEVSMRLVHASIDTSRQRDPIELAGLYQGDIMLRSAPPSFRNAVVDPAQRWKDGTIPYVISSSYDATERTTIARAMEEIERNTCVRFVPRIRESDYIHLLKAYGCSSNVGRSGGPQPITLDASCLYVGVIIHELMHAAGFWHEHSRNDRDNYIIINKANVQSSEWLNFKKYSWDEAKTLGVTYDLDSVMHYGPYAFAKNRSVPTIIPRVTGTKMGQRQGLSQKDIVKLRELYKCGAREDLPTMPPTSSLTTAAIVGSCEDLNQHCQAWAAAGECDANPAWMHKSCRKACVKCASGSAGGAMPCRDSHKYCRPWATRGECTSNPGYMLSICPDSCGRC